METAAIEVALAAAIAFGPFRTEHHSSHLICRTRQAHAAIAKPQWLFRGRLKHADLELVGEVRTGVIFHRRSRKLDRASVGHNVMFALCSFVDYLHRKAGQGTPFCEPTKTGDRVLGKDFQCEGCF
jgi:hypothetical protein